MHRMILQHRMWWMWIGGWALPVLANSANPDLVGWWRFDERQGNTTFDASGNGHVGALIGPIEWATSWDGSGALRFTGADNYVRVENSPKLNPETEITIAAWLKPSWTGNNRILQKEPEDRQYRLLKEWQDNLVFEIAGVGRLQHGGIPPMNEWTHLVATYDGSFVRMYYNAKEVDAVGASGKIPGSAAPLIIGNKRPGAVAGDEYTGLMDDVRIYCRALSPEEIAALVPQNQKAHRPDPPDGARIAKGPLMIWNPGHAAMYHDVYLGADSKLGREQYRGRQVAAVYWPDVQPQTTYYWRIDEVESDGATVHAGDVWAFTTEPVVAHQPDPPDQMKGIAPNAAVLSWRPGAGVAAHEVYLGTSQEEVAKAARDTVMFKGSRADAMYELGSIEKNRAYFWRVDEVDRIGVRRIGQVWRFTTGEREGGITGEYFDNLKLQGDPVCTRIDREINFVWTKSPPAPGVPARGFSVRWKGQVYVPLQGTYTFHTTVKGAVRLWVGPKLLVDCWRPHLLALDYEAQLPLEVGVYPITMEWSDMQYESQDGVAQLFWESAAMSKRIVRSGLVQPSTGARTPQ